MSDTWKPRTEKPDSGSRIVALFDDCSGATMFFVHDHGMIENDGEEHETLPKQFNLWAYLPSDYRLWIEDRWEEEPSP